MNKYRGEDKKLKGSYYNSIKLCFQSSPIQGSHTAQKSFSNKSAFCTDHFNTSAVRTFTALCFVLILCLASPDTSLFPA